MNDGIQRHGSAGPPWTFGDLLRGVAGGFVLAVLPLSVLFGSGLADELSVITLVGFISAALYISFGLSLWFFAIRRRGSSLTAAGFVRIPLSTVALLPLVAFGALILNALVVWVVRGLMGEVPGVREQVLPDGATTLDGSEFLVLFFVGAVLAPLAEEFLFRGLLFGFLRGRSGFLVAAVTSSFLFAVVHLSVRLIPSLFVLGLILAAITERYKSIYPAIGVHAINNALALGVLYASLA